MGACCCPVVEAVGQQQVVVVTLVVPLVVVAWSGCTPQVGAAQCERDEGGCGLRKGVVLLGVRQQQEGEPL